jgi:predicted nucleic acid-binding protein
MDYVFDSSFIVALIIPDEKNPKADKIHKALVESDEIYTPQLLWYEVANIFKNLLRRKRYTSEEVTHFFPLLHAVRLTTDFETGIGYAKKIWDLCNVYNLTSYDAAYLELAERKKAVLCTLDRNLKSAAKKHGVKVLNGI